jgi:hypothetical protein
MIAPATKPAQPKRVYRPANTREPWDNTSRDWPREPRFPDI